LRPVVIEYLNNSFNTDIFFWLIPNSLSIYIFAFIIVLIIFVNRSKTIGLSKSHAFWSAIWAIVFGLIGAKLYYLLQHIDAFIEKPSIFIENGTSSWGGYIGGMIGFLLSLKMYRAQILKYVDAVSSTFGLGIFIARWNCFLYGCCYPAYNAHLLKRYITHEAQTSIPVHPLQIYLGLNSLLLFIFASLFWQQLKHRPGITFCFFWLSYCITRFVLEFSRDDTSRGFINVLSVSQFICLLLIPPLLFGLWWFWNQQKKEPITGGIDEEEQDSH
jgi:phosphatidylglycerol:prolipoprotein diacylglycerol transferase